MVIRTLDDFINYVQTNNLHVEDTKALIAKSFFIFFGNECQTTEEVLNELKELFLKHKAVKYMPIFPDVQ